MSDADLERARNAATNAVRATNADLRNSHANAANAWAFIAWVDKQSRHPVVPVP